jgi:hypothetical protein
MDLADALSLSKCNDGYEYPLNFIHVFSRYTWSVPVKSTTSSSLSQALELLFKPITLPSNEAREFLNTHVHFLKKQDLSFHTTHDSRHKRHNN